MKKQKVMTILEPMITSITYVEDSQAASEWIKLYIEFRKKTLMSMINKEIT